MQQPAPEDYARALALLNAGELVALPTETVYGLGADAGNPAAVARIFAAKGRPADHPLIVHLADAQDMADWAREIPEFAQRLAAAFWPGPLTLILPKQAWVPDAVTGGQDSVGLRVPSHPVAQELLRRFAASRAGRPAGIAAPSANRFGRISPTTAAHVRDELADAVTCILDGGPCPVGIESTIVDCSRGAPVVLRPGHITPVQIAAVLAEEGNTAGAAVANPARESAPRASGSLAAHYAPATRLRVLPAAEIPAVLATQQGAGKRCGVLTHSLRPDAGNVHVCIHMPRTSAAYAHDFYAALRQLDTQRLDEILVEALPADPAWSAVADRLQRAAAHHLPPPAGNTL